MRWRRYIDKPLLVGGRKFHIRAYVLCVGSLAVYVFRSASGCNRAQPRRYPLRARPQRKFARCIPLRAMLLYSKPYSFNV